MIVLLLMLSGHHLYHHSCKSRQNPEYSRCDVNGFSKITVLFLIKQLLENVLATN